MKKIISILMCAIIMLSMVACGKSNNTATNVDDMKWEEVLEKAKGSTVTFYGWGGDEELNAWLDNVFAPKMKEKYDIKMERVPMDIDQVLSQLSGEIQAGEEDGSIDMIWINGENFKSAKENNMLYGPFLEKLPNAEKYLDLNADENKNDFGFPTEGYEAPYGKAQLVFMNDSAVTKNAPSSTKELLEFAKENKGKVTYPALPDFTGSAFVRNVIYDICGYEQFQDMKEDKETVKKEIQPALDYLVELNKYLWNKGKSFPADSTQLDNMFKDNEVVMNMTYSAYAVARGIENGSYTDTTKTFLFDKGTIGNTNYMAIAKNSGNKAGAMVAINEMISAEIQASRLEKLKTIPVVDNSKLSKEEKAAFDKVDIGKGAIPQDELLSKRLPEMPAGLVPIIEEIWLEEVVGK
ncbi:ABC transporter substrate-binding protein [Terrisporobacter petrolearius]|uniref:ABC transporter substrate-binding protein n=1 Tax=Terrisporobacter petrolearius TaxID=1460447 RepID=UPI001D1606DC|nr:ABC transporter substrate-binding protein [Terrisporobacter petrolearius]MCC3865891.1 ABC transporter substrate-binding protein [Terrisporobacter petrolearius]